MSIHYLRHKANFLQRNFDYHMNLKMCFFYNYFSKLHIQSHLDTLILHTLPNSLVSHCVEQLCNFANYFRYSIDYVLGLSNNRKCNINKEFSYKILGENIKKLRIKNNYSQSYLANKMKVTQACIVRWEKGLTKISLPNLYELAKFFNVTLSDMCYSL